MADDDLINQLSEEFKQRLQNELDLNTSTTAGNNSDFQNSPINTSNKSDNSSDNSSTQMTMDSNSLINLNDQLIHSKDYLEFKSQLLPKELNRYERMCKIAAKYFPVKTTENTNKKFQKYLETCHMNVTPAEVMSFTYFYTGVIFMLILFFAAIFGFLTSDVNSILFFSFGGLIVSSFLGYVFYNYPKYMANLWKLKASNHLVQSLFYTVTYLRHTPNLERAIDFTAQHLSPPLSLDFKKVMWDVESGKYSTIRESLVNYLTTWQVDNPAYTEAFNMVINSLNEGDESRRVELLNKALGVLLDGSYEKMLKYSHNLQQPVAMIHMLGVVLPLMATVMLPLVLSFMSGVRWYHIALLYDVLIPMFLYWKTKNIIATRPGFGGLSSEDIKATTKQQFRLSGTDINLSIGTLSLIIGLFFIFVGFSPVGILKLLFPHDLLLYSVGNLKIQLLGYRVLEDGTTRGPYSFISATIGLAVIFGIAYALGFYHKQNTKEIIKMRNKTLKLEDEFISVLFQLANRLSDGLPVEIAFQNIAESLPENQETKAFFSSVVYNLQNRGMGMDAALYDEHYGVIKKYPSPLIKSTMRILTDAAKKGPKVASEAMINVAQYMRQIKEVNRRINDLLAESLSGMKSIISFLAPVLTGIIVGLSAMISTVIIHLKDFMSSLNVGAGANITNMLSTGVPSYYFHIIIGLYVVSVVYILSELVSVIENGSDDVVKMNYIGKNLLKTAYSFTFLSGILTILFSFIALTVIGGV